MCRRVTFDCRAGLIGEFETDDEGVNFCVILDEAADGVNVVDHVTSF